MHGEAKAALEDLLSVTATDQVTPHRLQRWQTAARDLLSSGMTNSSRGSSAMSTDAPKPMAKKSRADDR